MNAGNKLRSRENHCFKPWWACALLIANNGLVLLVSFVSFKSLLPGIETVKANADLVPGAFTPVDPTVLLLFAAAVLTSPLC